MSDLIDYVSQHLSEDQITTIAKRLGVPEDQAESAINMALPTLVGSIARQSDDDDTIKKLKQTADEDGHDQLFSTAHAMLGQENAEVQGLQAFGGTDGLLGSLLGSRQSKVEQGIGKASGISAGQAGTILKVLGPLVLGAIMKKSKASDEKDVSEMLRSEKTSMENKASGGLLAGLFDQDNDGDFDFQDIVQLGMKRFFGKK